MTEGLKFTKLYLFLIFNTPWGIKMLPEYPGADKIAIITMDHSAFIDNCLWCDNEKML